MFNTKQSAKAFTLVELIVVIVILAILATIAFLSFSSQSWSARDSTRLSDISSIKKWMEMYNVWSWLYPTPDNPTSFTYSWGIIWNQWTLWDTAYKLIQKTLSKKVKDPLKDSEYDYSLASNKREYQVAWNFENLTSFEKNFNPFESNRLSPQFSFLNSPNANALWWTWVNVYISGNYNWILLKVLTGSTYYYIPTPTLFWKFSTGQSLISYDNSFSSWRIILPWVNQAANFINTSIYSTWWEKLSNTDVSALMTSIKIAYSGSNITTAAIQQIGSATGSELTNIWIWLIKNALGWSTSDINNIPNTLTCNAWWSWSDCSNFIETFSNSILNTADFNFNTWWTNASYSETTSLTFSALTSAWAAFTLFKEEIIPANLKTYHMRASITSWTNSTLDMFGLVSQYAAWIYNSPSFVIRTGIFSGSDYRPSLMIFDWVSSYTVQSSATQTVTLWQYLNYYMTFTSTNVIVTVKTDSMVTILSANIPLSSLWKPASKWSSILWSTNWGPSCTWNVTLFEKY
ncbi:MAG: hypothetical protein ACD_3C00037G0030 [uncultured bacterium (gcode 4)]|uniref:Uncharacterized protein n=1 Tax=uncultured bacterium (gcode 4) TaxID=1234023 RepID=K2GEK4_9BACT|nr:MAG: hypothetical protein ACD_3C00037G0030 [uncultured bacterium (gcode 4)]